MARTRWLAGVCGLLGGFLLVADAARASPPAPPTGAGAATCAVTAAVHPEPEGPAPSPDARAVADTSDAGEEEGFRDPNRSRLFLTPTGRALERGTGYVASYMLFFPFVAYGVTDRISVAAGTPILPDVTGEVLYLVPKITMVERSGLDLAVGALGLFLTREIDSGSVGILYGVGTLGDEDGSITAGAGWAYALGSGAHLSNDPVLVLGGEYRVGESTKLVTENWFATSSGVDGIFSGGIRFFGERLSADLGVGGGVGAGCCLPVVNFVYTFGRGG